MAASDLTTLANVRQWLGVTSQQTTDDALLSRLITSASNFIQTWLNRQIASQVYTETRNGTGGQRLLFANYPVTAVSSVTVDGIALSLAAQTVGGLPSNGYLFDTTSLYLYDYWFNRGFQNIQLAYTAGFASVPFELEQACIELIALRYRERDRIGQRSKSVGGETIGYFIGDMPASTMTLLQNYKKVIPI